MEKATFEDLIARKMQKEEDKYKYREIEVKSLGKSLIFKKPSDNLVLEIFNEIDSGKDVKKVMDGYRKLIYMSCELLQDTKLHKELEIIDPIDSVSEIFDLADIMQLGEELMDFIGFDVDEQIKN